MTEVNTAERFRNQVLQTWLPTYCDDPKRAYAREGFRATSIQVADIDAFDCMRAIESGLVTDVGGGRYVAPNSSALEVLFWEGRKLKTPRTITLWLEPVITFAALARLHFEHGWPKELLGTQPKTWAFDLSAHSPARPDEYRILGEVKKTVDEAQSLIADLLSLSTGAATGSARANSLKKWKAILISRPPIAWVVGPGGFSKVFTVAYPPAGSALLTETAASALQYSVNE